MAALPFDPFVFEEIPHDAGVERLRAAARLYDSAAIGAAFLAGLGGSAPRGRQSLSSWAFAAHLPQHDFVPLAPKDPDGACRICGLDRRVWLQPVHERFRLYQGMVWNETPVTWIIDLEEQEALSALRPSSDDRARLRALLDLIDAAPEGESPGRLEKRIAKAKLLPSTDVWRRYGLLAALGDGGVLRTLGGAPAIAGWRDLDERLKDEAKATAPRGSEIPLPLSVWRGGLLTDRGAARSLFGEL